jgi:hypothetical protein
MLKQTQRIGDNIFPSSGNAQITQFNVSAKPGVICQMTEN